MSFSVTMQSALNRPHRQMAQVILPRQTASRMGHGATETVDPAQRDLADFNQIPLGFVIEAMPRKRLTQILPVVIQAFQSTYAALPENIRSQYDLGTNSKWPTSPEDLQKKAWIEIKNKNRSTTPFWVSIGVNESSPDTVRMRIESSPHQDKIIDQYETQNPRAFIPHHQAMWYALYLAGMPENKVRWLY